MWMISLTTESKILSVRAFWKEWKNVFVKVGKRYLCAIDKKWEELETPWKLALYIQNCEWTSTIVRYFLVWIHLWNSVKMATSTQLNRRPQQRYNRSSTASVTQLISESCNSLLQRFRRPPSEKFSIDKTFSLVSNR